MEQDLKDKPNAILFISHDTGASASCEGGPFDTPNLDRVAENGVRFTNHFSTAPQCTPSRGCLITGKYPHSNGLMGLTNQFQPFSQGRSSYYQNQCNQ